MFLLCITFMHWFSCICRLKWYFSTKIFQVWCFLLRWLTYKLQYLFKIVWRRLVHPTFPVIDQVYIIPSLHLFVFKRFCRSEKCSSVMRWMVIYLMKSMLRVISRDTGTLSEICAKLTINPWNHYYEWVFWDVYWFWMCY